METGKNLSRVHLCCVVVAGLMMFSAASAYAQRGVVNDWSSHHVIFSSPGTETGALMNGNREAWQKLVSNPRFRMQQLRRSPEWANRLRNIESGFSEIRAQGESNRRVLGTSRSALDRDWAVPITGTADTGTALDMYPGVYSPGYTTASCSDYVVFPVNAAGKDTGTNHQANLVGFNNLYETTCTGTVPTVSFAYYVGTGKVQTSPSLSEDGTKIAFVESITNGSVFYVLTLGTTGNNGTSYSAPAVPGSGNNASDVAITLSGRRSVTRSSPFVDYTDDIAYVGDDTGRIHKITCVFNPTGSACTPAETTTGGWPFRVSTASTILTGPVYDSTSEHLFVGSSGGDLYCVDLSGTDPAACANASVSVADGTRSSGAVLDTPIVDSTAETVFAEAVATNGSRRAETTEAVLLQANTALSDVVRVDMGDGGTNLYDGDFDNTYYNSNAGSYGGFLYFCGNATGAATPTLYRVGFTTAGVMNGARDSSSYQLVATGQTGTAVSCAPLTEIYNGTTDYMFLGVEGHGNPSGCGGDGCVMSFVIGNSSGSAGSISEPTATYSLGGNGRGASGIVLDNISTQPGASQVYFGNLQDGDATQASQAGLN